MGLYCSMTTIPLADPRLRHPQHGVRQRQRLRVARRYNGIEFEGRVADDAVFVPPERLVALCSEELQPVRQFPEYKGQPNKPGYFYWNGRHVGYESRLELSVFEITVFLTGVRLLREQPVRIHFGHRQGPFVHVPDLLVGRRLGLDHGPLRSHELLVVDVKGARRLHENERLFRLTRDALAEAGVGYAIAVEPEPVTLRNIQFLRGYQFPSLGTEELLGPITNAVAAGRLLLGELVDGISADADVHPAVVRPALFHLLYVHALSFDATSLLSDGSLIGPGHGPTVVANRMPIEPWQPLDQLLTGSPGNGGSR